MGGAFFGALFCFMKMGSLNQYARNTLAGLAVGTLAYNTTIPEAPPEILDRNYLAAAITGIGALYFEWQMHHPASNKDSFPDITDRLAH